ncbi:hypothetical protein [Halorussus halobius]|uniref:hypothetical protein n=1 Tax=Halorussus halobius TaxID=1710537 RepID=UPI001091C21A|nr:hypothetical protein [Halorussus halobius]
MARLRTAALALVAVALVGVAGWGGLPGPADAPAVEPAAGDSTVSGAPAEDALVRPEGSESLLWPYTSAGRSVESRTLAINIVLHGGPGEVRQALTDERGLEWNRTDDGESEADAGTHAVVVDDDGVDWSAARGSTRYSYVEARASGANASGANVSDAGNAGEARTGEWVRPDYQLHAGTYLGTRQHLRAYESPRAADEWTALQAHAEYWDWFRLRHTVTDVQGAARTVEREFVGEPYVSEVRREYRGNRGGGNDGWITAVELALAALVVGASTTRRLPSAREVRATVESAVAEEGRKFVLPATLVALYLGVRASGVWLEGAFPGTSPKVFAGALYPVLAVGVPVAAARTARPLDPTTAFALAVAGLGAAFVLDFSTLGLVALSIRLVLHRVALLVSLGLLAAGSARADGPPDRRALAVGVAGWAVCLALPLFGVL